MRNPTASCLVAPRAAVVLFAVLMGACMPTPRAHATFPGRNGAMLIDGSTANYDGACTETRRPRPVGHIADPDMECEWDSPPPSALFLFGPWPRGLRHFAPDARAAFSPSGARVALVTDGRLRLQDAAGGGGGRVIRRGVEDVAWTPSGRLIAVSVRAGDESDPVLLTLSLSGRGRVLRRGGEPEVSVTGRIAYIDPGSRLRIMRADGSRPRTVVRAARASDAAPSWSPDGRRLAFVRSDPRTGRRAIWTVRPDGRGLHRVTTFVAGGFAPYDPKWSPDGRTIAFNALRGVRAVSADAQRPLGRPQWRSLLLNAGLIDWQPRR